MSDSTSFTKRNLLISSALLVAALFALWGFGLIGGPTSVNITKITYKEFGVTVYLYDAGPLTCVAGVKGCETSQVEIPCKAASFSMCLEPDRSLIDRTDAK